MGSSLRNLLAAPLPQVGTKVEVTWIPADQQTMQRNRCLYLYQYSNGTVYYIGKAYDCTVAERRQSHADEGLITIGGFIEPSRSLTIWVGIVKPQAGQQLNDSLVSDVEALLIREVRPTNNTVTPSVSRDNLEVTCNGYWPLSQSVFTNNAMSVFMNALRLGRQ